MFAEAAHSGQLHSEVDVFIAFGFRVCFEEHRHAKPVALLKRHVHDAPHIPLPLIRFAHADQAVLRAVIIISERVSDVLNDALVQLCDLHTDSSRF